ncbi:MAG TPA: histidine kinase [Terriglobales bacterium]|jgi:signal transduction histidine kinase|nr:histidine kinase [Terriglobales bacterium]
MSRGEVRRIERWLASARVFLAVSALVAIWMDPGEIRYSLWAFALLAFYLAQGVVIIIFLRRRQESTPAFRLLVHSADIVWPALISMFASGQNNPFFLFFVFVLAAAAYRWGLWETVGTAAAEVSLLWIEALSFHWGLVAWITGLAARYGLPPLRIDPHSFEPKGLFMRSVYLLVLGFLLGYLAEQQKQLRAEKAVIARTLGKARVEAGVAGTLHEIASELLSMYRARQLVIASQEISSYRVYIGELSYPEQGDGFRWLDPSDSDRQIYLQESPSAACYAERNGSGGDRSFSLLALDQETRIDNVNPGFLEPIARKHEFDTAMMVSFVFGQEWRGRLFLLDPKLTGETEEELRFLQELVHQVGPAVYNVLLLRRLRLRAGAVERARFARELHDGAVQSLIAVEMQVDVLRRQSATKPDVVPKELGRIQALLREEVLKLRELMQQMKTLDVDSKKLLGVIHDTVERFQRETGIVSRFTSDLEEVDMPQPVCRELARIVQEALVNVRKHSQARQVGVRLGAGENGWKIVIEDDGQGFPFTGRLSHQQLDDLGKGPLVIKERVRLIEGELTIESNPGQGSRLEITIPQQQGVIHG